MKQLFSAFLFLLTLSSGTLTAAPYYYFEHYTTYEGLPSNTIHCTYQDRYGFVWIGTRDGLCRFDGYDFREFGGDGSARTSDLASMDLGEDEDGLLWFSNSAGIAYFDPASGETTSFGQLGETLCFHLVPDLKGNVWFASNRLFRYDKKEGAFHDYAFQEGSPAYIAIDSYDAVWVVLTDGSLFNYDKRRDRFNMVAFPRRLSIIRQADDGKLLAAATDGEILLIDTVTLDTETILRIEGREIRHILERRPGEYWVGTNDGLFVKQMDTGELAEVYHHEQDPNSLSASFITSLDKDKAGNVWVGTYYAGLNVWQDKKGAFSIYYPNPSGSTMVGSVVRSIIADPDGSIWFCTEDGGLNRLNPSDPTRSENFTIRPNLNMQGLAIDGDDLWIFTFGDGVYRFDRKAKRVRQFYPLAVPGSGCGIRTDDGSILAGSQNGLFRYSRELDTFEFEEAAGRDFIHSLYEDSRDNLWIGTYGNGYYVRDAQGAYTPHIKTDTEGGLTADRITSFFEDSRHRIWITTEGGGICYTGPYPALADPQLQSLTRRNGLLSNVTCAVAEDEEGILWVSSTRGITRINAETAQIEDLLFERQQVIGSQFSYGAVLTTRGGMIYMGNTNGLIAFSPAKMKKAVRDYPLYITHIEARNADGVQILHEPGRSALTTEHLRIKSKDASLLEISFAAPDFSILQQVVYSYRLMRNGHEMLAATLTDNEVNFSGLPPGRYLLEVGIVGSDTPISRKSLRFDILAPPLWSTTAKILYALALLALLAVFLRELNMKRRRDRARHLTKVENQKQKEIYEAKINFFTNITHEIRTPLTLIKMPLDKLIAEKQYTPKAEKDMLTIQANTDRLLNLTNQLLDLRKMEKNEIRPVFLKEDLAGIVRKSCAHFEQMAAEQNITLAVDLPDGPFEVMCVRDSVEKIIGNLLSNGVKYTKDRIDVSLRPSGDGTMALLRVDSNGAVIPIREAEKIFEVFYQVGDGDKGKGTGLGLPFARSLAELHGGQLFLDTNRRDCNSFVLELPIHQQTPTIVMEERKAASGQADSSPDYDSSRHTLLIVEDSAEMRSYLARELSDDYNIVTAANGQDAMEKVRQERVDLVVSDVMMPVMDGCQLCNAIKTNMEFSHLPVLLLTAAVGMETRLQTLEVGADGYIEKPFPIELLRANIANLFKNREISYKQFTNSPLTHFNSVNASKIDEEFMEKLHGIVMKHMAEQDLSIETLTGLIGTSKSTLYRKVKANTGLNINEYIRLCRLKQAAEMLSSQKYRINEVAYMVGFSSPSYFATSFQKQFNISPSAFVKNLKD